MKKILAILLALCLTLSLTVVAFAENSPSADPGNTPPPSYQPGTGSASAVGSTATSKYTFKATTANGAPLTATVAGVTSGDVYNEVTAYGVVAVYSITITSNVSPDEIVDIDVYAPGATADSKVIVRDEWEVLDGVTLTVNGNRAVISAPAGVLNTWHYVAIVNEWDAVDVANPQQSNENQEESEDVTDDTPAVDVEEEPAETTPAEETPAETEAPAETEQNPTTGIALAVVPMIVSAAAAVISKRR